MGRSASKAAGRVTSRLVTDGTRRDVPESFLISVIMGVSTVAAFDRVSQ
jgi:hypothetical protein